MNVLSSLLPLPSPRLAVSLKCPFTLAGGVSKGREGCILHLPGEECRAVVFSRPAEIVLRPDLFLRNP